LLYIRLRPSTAIRCGTKQVFADISHAMIAVPLGCSSVLAGKLCTNEATGAAKCSAVISAGKADGAPVSVPTWAAAPNRAATTSRSEDYVNLSCSLCQLTLVRRRARTRAWASCHRDTILRSRAWHHPGKGAILLCYYDRAQLGCPCRPWPTAGAASRGRGQPAHRRPPPSHQHG
jgi:hypothetical protein